MIPLVVEKVNKKIGLLTVLPKGEREERRED
jgi:hypothetical protein